MFLTGVEELDVDTRLVTGESRVSVTAQANGELRLSAVGHVELSMSRERQDEYEWTKQDRRLKVIRRRRC